MVVDHQIQWDNEKVARLWDFYSRTPRFSDVYFSKIYGSGLLKRSGLSRVDKLDIVDFGCGPGFIWEHMLRLGLPWRYTGVDFSPKSVSLLRAKASGDSRFGGVHHVTELPTPLPSAAYDGVLLFEVVEHLTDEHLHSTLKEIARLLKPGGKLVISTPNAEDLDASTRYCPSCGAVFHEWQHVRSWTPASLDASVSGHGFEIARITTEDLAANTPARKAVRLARRLLGRGRTPPHMIATFVRAPG